MTSLAGRRPWRPTGPIVATTIALVVVVLVALSASAATAATQSCGHSCIDLFSKLYGTHAHPRYVADVPDQTARVGQPIILTGASGSNAGEDFKVSYEGTVDQAYAAGLVSAALDLHYGTLPVFEFAFEPDGVDSGLCEGVGATPVDGGRVTLQPCGVSAKTLWVVDEPLEVQFGYVPLINGATTDFADPQVLTELQPGLPLFTFALTSANSAVFANQMWGADYGRLVTASASVSQSSDSTSTAQLRRLSDPASGTDSLASPFPATAYTANLLDATATPVDGATNTAGTAVAAGGFPDGVAITPDGSTAYVTNGVADTVTPINVANNTPGAAIAVGGWAYAVAVTPDGKTAYVANFDSGTVTPINVATNTPGPAIAVGDGPDAVAVTPDGKTAYVANFDSGTVTPIDVATNVPGTPIPVGDGPDAVAVSPDGTAAYVTNSTDGTVTPIDVATNVPGTAIPVGNGPDAVAFTPDATTAYVTNSTDATVTPIDVASGTAGTPIPVGDYPDGVAITPDGGTAYITSLFDGTVTPLDLATGTAASTVAIGPGSGPDGIAVTGPMQIGTPPGLPQGVVGSPYDQHLWALAGTAPFTYAITSGSLPPGLSLSTSGVISGTPTTAQDASFTVSVTDSSTDQRVATKAFTLTVLAGPTVVTQPSDQRVDVGSAATFTVAFAGTPAPTIQWQVSTDGGMTFTDIPGATSATLTVNAVTASQSGDRYRARGTNSVSPNVASNAATLTVVVPTAPSELSAPSELTGPTVAGSPTTGQRLTCQAGAWTNAPTSYTYQWTRDGTPIAGATGSTYTVGALDQGSTLACIVTAINAVGTSSAGSATVKIPVPVVAQCPAATGKVSGATLGLVKLGETRKQAERGYSHSSDRGKRYEDFFCLTPIGVRVGYPSPQLLRGLSKATVHRYTGRVIWISTANPYYAVGGVRPGTTVARAARRLRLGKVFVVGLNDWYFAPAGGAVAIFKVRRGIVQEIGIASPGLTQGRRAQRRFLTSFH